MYALAPFLPELFDRDNIQKFVIEKVYIDRQDIFRLCIVVKCDELPQSDLTAAINVEPSLHFFYLLIEYPSSVDYALHIPVIYSEVPTSILNQSNSDIEKIITDESHTSENLSNNLNSAVLHDLSV